MELTIKDILDDIIDDMKDIISQPVLITKETLEQITDPKGEH